MACTFAWTWGATAKRQVVDPRVFKQRLRAYHGHPKAWRKKPRLVRVVIDRKRDHIGDIEGIGKHDGVVADAEQSDTVSIWPGG